MATITYYALESKNTYEYHYYYFAGLDDAGNVIESKKLELEGDFNADDD